MSSTNSFSPRSSLQINERRDSTASSSRTVSPIAIFHDGITRPSDIDLPLNNIGAKRRAQAIATAPRRNRNHDEEDDNDQKKNFFGFVHTPAVAIPTPVISQQTQSLPQTQLDISLIPSFRIDPPTRADSTELEYVYNHSSHRIRSSSGPFP